MEKLIQHLKVYIAQQYFLFLSTTCKPFLFLDRYGMEDEKPTPLPLKWRVAKFFCTEEMGAIEKIYTPETYDMSYDSRKKGFDHLTEMVKREKNLMNERIALFILEVMFTSYGSSGSWSKEKTPNGLLKECLRYIHTKEKLQILANDMITLHGKDGEKPMIGGAEATWNKHRLVDSAIMIYRECDDTKGMLRCANYLWDYHSESYAYPKERHELLNLFLEINTPEARDSLSKIVAFFKHEGSYHPGGDYDAFAVYCRFLEKEPGMRAGFLV